MLRNIFCGWAHLILSVLALSLWYGESGVGEEPRTDSGSSSERFYRLRPAVAFYVHNPRGLAFDLQVSRRDLNFYCHGPRELSIKIMDPDERELFWYEFPDDGITAAIEQSGLAGWDHDLWMRAALWDTGQDSPMSFSAFSDPARIRMLPEARKTFSVPAGKPGVYEVIACGSYDHWLGFQVTPPLPYGVLGHPDMLYGTGNLYASSHVYVPPTAEKMEVWLIEPDIPRRREVTLRSESGQVLGQLAALGGKNELSVPVDKKDKDTVWRIDISDGGDYLLKIRHVPGILCPDQESARAIHGRTITLPDGQVVFGRLQQRAYEYILRTFKPPDLAGPLPQFTAEFVNSVPPAQVELLFTRSYMPAQGLYDVLGSMNRLARKLGPEASMPDMVRQFRTHFILDNLALFCTQFPQGNPCYRDPRFLRVATFAYLCALFEYGPADVYLHDQAPYAGLHSQGFHLLWKGAHGLWLLKDHLAPEARDLLTEGVRRCADRLATVSDIELCLTNMYSSIPSGLYFAHLATGEERYRSLSLRHAYRIADAAYGPHTGQAPAGYYREHFALDPGYNSMTTYQLGLLHALSQDAKILESLQRDWRFIVHQVLEEPDGGRLGPSDFASRTPSAFVDHQWGEPVRWVQGLIPEAGAFAGTVAPADETVRKAALTKAVEAFQKWPEDRELNLVARGWVGSYATYLWRVAEQKPIPAPLPIREPGSFSRNFGNEFFCIKRPGYYIIVNAIQPVPAWMNPLFGGYLGFTGGAISALWTPDGGTCLLGRMPASYGVPMDGWDNAWLVNTVVGLLENGTVFTTGISVPTSRFDPDRNVLEVSGECRRVPLLYARRFEFLDDRIRAQVTLRNSGRVRHVWMGMGRHQGQKVKELHELFPYVDRGDLRCFSGEGKPVIVADQRAAQVQGVQWLGRGGGVYLVFSRPFDLRLHTTSCSAGRGTTVRAFSVRIPAEPLEEKGAQAPTVFAVPESDGGDVTYTYQLIPFRGSPAEADASAAIRSAMEAGPAGPK